MVIYNLGSIADDVYARLDNIPTSISGAQMLKIAYEQVIFAERFTGLSIGSVAIAERFQPALIALTQAEIQRYIELQGADVNSYSIGAFQISKSQGNSSQSASLKQEAMQKLKLLGRSTGVYKSFG